MRGSLVVDLDAEPSSVTRRQRILSYSVSLRRSELVQLERALTVLLESRATITVLGSENNLRLGVALVHVLLQPAQRLGFRPGGCLAAKRAPLVVLPALAKACRADLLAAARVEHLLATSDWQLVQADGARAAPVRRVDIQRGGLDRLCRPHSR
jgi:hypothetical protein